jgi:hypothetical protein
MTGYSVKLGPIAIAVCIAWVPKLKQQAKDEARAAQARS